MKAITVPKESEFLSIDGKPFAQVKRDKQGTPVFQKSMDNQGNEIILHEIQMIDGAPVAVVIPEKENLDWVELMKITLGRIQGLMLAEKKEKKEDVLISWDDSSHATQVYRVLNIAAPGKIIELGDTDHEWWSKHLDQYLTQIYGFNAHLLREPVQEAEDIGKPRTETRREAREDKEK